MKVEEFGGHHGAFCLGPPESLESPVLSVIWLMLYASEQEGVWGGIKGIAICAVFVFKELRYNHLPFFFRNSRPCLPYFFCLMMHVEIYLVM